MASTFDPDLEAEAEQVILVLRAQPHAPYVQRITDPPRFTCHRTSERPLRGPAPLLTCDNPTTFNLLLEAAELQVLPAPSKQH